MATELRVSHPGGCSPRRTAWTSWTGRAGVGGACQQPPGSPASTARLRLRLACATAAATAPPGAIRKHVRSGCAGPHWHARACEGSVGQLACRGFGDSTAATWRRCCLARVSASATPTADFTATLHFCTTCTTRTTRTTFGPSAHPHPRPSTLTVQHSPLSQNSPSTSPECTFQSAHSAHGRPRSLVATASPSMWARPTLSVTLSPRPPSAPFLAWPGQAEGERRPSRLIAGSLNAATLQWPAEPCMPSLDAPNVAPSSCLTGFCALVIRQLLPLNAFHHVVSTPRSTHLPLPLDLHFAIRLETGAGPATRDTQHLVAPRSSLSVTLRHLSLLAVDPIGRLVSQPNQPLRKTHSRFTPSTYDSACSPAIGPPRMSHSIADRRLSSAQPGSLAAWQPGAADHQS
jgi:hypothetical protein